LSRPHSGDETRPMVDELIRVGAAELPSRRGIPEPRREARWLLAAAAGVSEAWLRLHPAAKIPAADADRYLTWIARRKAGEPAEHLTGSCTFWGRSFHVSPAVLIPRPETELIVELALQLEQPAASRVLDVGTGSGCLAVTLAAERPGWSVFAVDRSLAALCIAQANGEALEVNVDWFLADLATAAGGPFDLVTANLPYLPTRWMADLPIEVRHDPPMALDGGADGLDPVRRLLGQLGRVLAQGGVCLLEIAEGQADEVRRSARQCGLDPFVSRRDVGGCERVVGVRR